MIVKSIKKVPRKSEYLVTIDNDDYKFKENIVVKYRLVKNKEIDKETLKMAISENDFESIYLKTERYVINYSKSEKEVVRYLKKKEVDNLTINKIIDKLRKLNLIDDTSLVESLVYSYIKKYNGVNLIGEKLKQKGIDYDLIDKALSNIDYDTYYLYLNKLYEKVKHRYDKYDSYIRKNKIKKYLLSRGYTYSDIEKLSI